jgi:hypothetical protein
MSRSVLLLCAALWVISVCMACPAPASEGKDGDPIPSNLGIGIGVPYGGLGVNYEAGEQTRLSLGVGRLPQGIGWSIGAKHYLQPPVFGEGRFAVSAYYGVNEVARTGSLLRGYDYETDTGFSVGIGWSGEDIDIGILYAFNDLPAGYDDYGPLTEFYLGYRF